MRSIQISYARLLGTPQTSFDLSTGTGSISVSYTVGEIVAEVIHPDGSIVGPLERDHPTATAVGTATVSLGPADTAAERFLALIGIILAQEGLNPANGDHVFSESGSQLV